MPQNQTKQLRDVGSQETYHSNNFAGRNFFNSGIVHISLMHIGITLLLVVLLGIGQFLAQWPGLLQFQHGRLLGGTLELPCPMPPFGRATENTLQYTFWF